MRVGWVLGVGGRDLGGAVRRNGKRERSVTVFKLKFKNL